jgi:hypothetical protein
VRELSWSLSKAHLFEECPRRFYYQYYYSKSGFAPDAPEDARLALEMSSITGLDMWAGDIVHQTIQWTLERVHEGLLPSADEARAEAQNRLSAGWKASVNGLWRQQRDDRHPNLFEHYYDIPVGPNSIDRVKDRVYVSVENLMRSSLFNTITTSPLSSWLPIEKFSSFRIDGILFYVKLDFAMKRSDRIEVYDWKTGKPREEEALQLACYSLYASGRWELPIENITATAVHLHPALDLKKSNVDEGSIEDLRAFAKKSFNSMVRCMRNPARNIAAMDDFPMTGNLLRCARCNFRGICVQGKQASGDVDDLPVVDDWWGG